MSTDLIMVKYGMDGFVRAVLETTNSSDTDTEAFNGVVTILDDREFAVFFKSDTPVIQVLKKGLELAPLVALAGATKH